MYNHNKAQQSKNRVHISWDILYASVNYDIIFSDNGFSTVWHRAIIWASAGLFSVGSLGRSSVKFKMKFKHFQSSKCIWECNLQKCQPFCLGFNVANTDMKFPSSNFCMKGNWNIARAILPYTIGRHCRAVLLYNRGRSILFYLLKMQSQNLGTTCLIDNQIN